MSMIVSVRTAWWSLGFLVAVLGFAVHLAQSNSASASAQDACPPGQVQAETVSLGEVVLSNGAPPYATMMLTRLTLQPGQSLDPIPKDPSVYYVESGILKYPFQPWLGIMAAPNCVPENGPLTAGGTTTVDGDGMVIVSQGQALIAESGATGPIINGGTTPLVILQMTVVSPELDPVTGLPIVDPATAGREQTKAFEERKQACKAEARKAKRSEARGTPESEAPSDQGASEPVATPAVSTSGWASDAQHPTRTMPRACQGP